jgi:hypothetical protein
MTTVEKATRKPGRPRKYEGGRHNTTVRFTPTRYDALKSQAEENRRSISEEVEARVERSFTDDKLTEIERGVREISNEIADM